MTRILCKLFALLAAWARRGSSAWCLSAGMVPLVFPVLCRVYPCAAWAALAVFFRFSVIEKTLKEMANIS